MKVGTMAVTIVLGSAEGEGGSLSLSLDALLPPPRNESKPPLFGELSDILTGFRFWLCYKSTSRLLQVADREWLGTNTVHSIVSVETTCDFHTFAR